MTTARLRMAAAIAAALALAPVSHAGAESVALTRLFPLEATVEVDGGGLARLVLPTEVLKACRPDLSDLRLFDRSGRPLALLVDSGRTEGVLEATERFEPEVLDLRRDETRPEDGPARFRETYRIQSPLRAPDLGQDPSAELAWELVFEGLPSRFVRDVRVAARSVDGEVEILVDRTSIFRLDAETSRTRIALPAMAAGETEMLDVTIEGAEGGFLEPRLRLEAVRRLEPLSRIAIALEEIERTTRDGRTIIDLARPSGVVPRLLRLETSTGAFDRRIEVFDDRAGRDPRRVASGRVFRLAGTPDGERVEIPMSGGGARGAVLRVSLQDHDSPPLDDLRFTAVVRQPVIVFELPEQDGMARATLRFGGGRAFRPRYDLSTLSIEPGGARSGAEAAIALRLHDAARIPLARLGPVAANPEFDTRPALAFAMHPGAALDVRVFEYRRALTVAPSEEGLSRLELGPEDTARARVDLSDVRILDGRGRQWPYLVQRDARRGSVALALEPDDAPRKQSRWLLRPPVSPLRMERIELHSTAPYFDRAYRLYALDEDGDEHLVRNGRLRKDARRPRPSVIRIPAERSHGFALEIEDGDDAPLVLVSARARVPLPVLYLAADAGAYTLLIGHPELAAPAYELERVRDLVLAVGHREIETAALEANPEFSTSARLRFEGGVRGWIHTGLVWAVLLVAVAGLAAMTLRAARPAPGGSGAEGAAGDV